ncbi:hypothetical protein EON65_48395, partial [archaeon]
MLDASRLFTLSDDSLPPGQLTSQGFMQHIELGIPADNMHADRSSIPIHKTHTHAHTHTHTYTHTPTRFVGQTLREKYLPFLSTLASPQQLYVRSTNYARTVISVSALLTA